MKTLPIKTDGGSMSENEPTVATPSAHATAFDYSSVEPELAESLKADAESIRSHIMKSTRDIIEIGRALQAAKGRLQHGQFVQWVETAIGLKHWTAQRYMGVADLVRSKGDSLTLLPPMAAYQLASKEIPPEVIDALAQLGQRLCQTPEAFKAWSQNLGHEGVLTTFTSYGEVASARQAEILRELAQPGASRVEISDEVRRVLLKLAGGALTP